MAGGMDDLEAALSRDTSRDRSRDTRRDVAAYALFLMLLGALFALGLWVLANHADDVADLVHRLLYPD